jgi:nucleotide-binding universal stress UspA family protein
MGLYECILVPTDGSAASRPAIEHAVSLAEIHDAAIHAIYVINTASFASIPTEGSWEGVSEMLEREGGEALEEVADAAEEAGVPVECVQIDGAPSREIVRYAEKHGCDLIVMGTHGRGGIDRLLLGSVAEKVVRSSSIPVLTMHGEQ